MNEPRKMIIGGSVVTPALNLVERDGRSIKVEPRTMDLLVYLAGRAGEVVSLEEAIAHVGDGRVVEDSALYKRINQLRKILGDDAKSPMYIETIPKRGYRLIADVSPLTSGPVSSGIVFAAAGMEGRRGWRGIAAAGLSAVALAALGAGIWSIGRFDETATSVRAVREAGPEMPSVAVLPFTNTSAAGENARFFADGMHAELLTQLGRLDGLRVIARDSVLAYGGSGRVAAEVGRDLGVANVLEGVVQRSADTVRINVRLVDVQTSDQLWAETYDKQITALGIFGIQSEIAIAIADALHAQLREEELARLRALPTENTRAYDFFLSGVGYARSRDWLTHLPLAIEQLENAVREAPEFAVAWAELSMALRRNSPLGVSTPLALEAAERALALDPDLPEAHLAMAFYHFGADDSDAALRELAIVEGAMVGDPAPTMLRASIYERRAQWAEARATLERALELDPRNVELLVSQARTQLWLRDYAAAERSVDRALEFAPDADAALVMKVSIAVYGGGDLSFMKELVESPLIDRGLRLQFGWQTAVRERDYPRALAYLDQMTGEMNPFGIRPLASHYGYTYALAGSPERARREFEKAREHMETLVAAEPDSPVRLLHLAEAVAGSGDGALAVELAQRAIAQFPPGSPQASEALRVAVHWVYVPARDFDTAFAALDEYLSAPAPGSIEGLLAGPRLDALRGDPRLEELWRKYARSP